MSEDLEEIINKVKWRFTGHIYEYFMSIDKLYKEKQIGKERYDWLTKERPGKLIKEMVNNHLLIKEEKI